MKALLIDTETTGLISNGSIALDKQPEIIEFYALGAYLEDGEICAECNLLFNPKIPITAEITKITGITNDMVKGQFNFCDLSKTIMRMLLDADLIIAHNASFDKEMLDLEFKRLGQTIAWPRIICTVEQTIHLKGYRLSLSELHEYLFNVPFKGAHRAKEDVAALLRCCVELHRMELI